MRATRAPARARCAALLAACAAAVGCTGPAGAGGSPAAPGSPAAAPVVPATSPPPVTAPAPTGGTAGVSAVPDAIVAAMRADLEGRLPAGARSGIRVVSAEPVTWPDGAMGCGRPGEMYTQALVPGYRVVFAAPGQGGETRYAYHANERGYFKLCEAGATAPLPAGGDPTK